MAMETFTYKRQSGATGTITYAVRESQFGDGYVQVIGDGINTRRASWPLSFEGGLDDMLEIVAFFDRHAGYKSFYWTPPDSEDPLMWRVANVSLTSIGAGVYRVSAEFKQVYFVQ